MCGICGYVDKNKNITNNSCIKRMNDKLKKRGPNSSNIFISKNVALGHSRLSIIDVTFGNQPMTKIIDDKEYTIVYNGEIYNTSEIRDDLISKGYNFDTKCDTEVVLTSYIEYGTDSVNYLNGIFAYAIYEKKSGDIFLVRDRLGIKPLFFAENSNFFIFASEIKSILECDGIKPILDKNGLMELIGLGPAHSPGKTYFKNIFELKAGHFAKFSGNELIQKKYWDLETKECLDSEAEAIDEIHFLLTDATKRQLVSDVGICSMLSGGIDSSILTKVAHDNIPDISTFSIDFVDNDKNFVANDYQLSKDNDYVEIMKDFLDTNHIAVTLDNEYLFSLLDESMIARDMPGMADIDSSMFAFCKSISDNNFKVCLSGECADEIFGGYPWFYRERLVNHDGFPWALSENLRSNLLKKDILKENELNEYVQNSRKDTLKNIEHLDKNDLFENKFRDINYLTIKWFMTVLLERTDRMSMSNSLEVRVPFADHRIFEYVYNLPARMKLGVSKVSNPTEKYLLRKAFENELPEKIIYRKKSPFPKTYDPKYLNLVEKRLINILNDKNSKLSKILNIDFIQNILNYHGENLTENLFGQLMTYPQTLAFLIQIDSWIKYYNIELDL